MKVSASSVSTRYLSTICTLIVIYQTFPPAKVIFAGIGVLLLVSALVDLLLQAIVTPVPQAAKDVDASQDMLIDLFERIESFFKRLESYTELKPSEAMTDMMAKIMVEVLSIMAIVTVEIKQRRPSQFVSSVLGSRLKFL